MKPIIYLHHFTVQPEDLDELNHVNNAVYLQYIQEAGTQHWYDGITTDISDGMRWVARRHEIDYLKPAFLNDELTIKTWIEEFSGVTCKRRCEIKRGDELLAKSLTTWVSVDAVTFRPKRFGEEVSGPFFEK